MRNGLKTALLLGLMSGLLLIIGEALGGGQGLVTAFFFAAAMNFASYWFSDKIVLSMYSAQEVGPGHRLYQVVERTALIPMSMNLGRLLWCFCWRSVSVPSRACYACGRSIRPIPRTCSE